MTVAHLTGSDPVRAQPLRQTRAHIRIGLLGLGQVGSAVARLIARPRASGPAVEIVAALVRHPARPRAVRGVAIANEPEHVFDARPSVVVEVLGGLEPARTLVLEAIRRGLPVVTANKSLLAHHGDELLKAAALAGVPLHYEASVIAGVPFLGTFARRPYASAISALTGIVNGTTNYILSQMQEGTRAYVTALADAQRLGFAEPDPSNDVGGIDAAEKLSILIRQFAGRRIEPGTIETGGIEHITSTDFVHARELGGTLKPVVRAQGLESGAPAIAAFAGPAFVPANHPLARVHQASNALCLRDIAGSHLSFTGPGAGPDVTAVTILDDVLEAASRPEDTAQAHHRVSGANGDSKGSAGVVAPHTAWFLRVTSDFPLPAGSEMADLLGAHGVWSERTTARYIRDGGESQAFLTYPCERPRIERAAAALTAATGATARTLRALEPLA